MSQQNMQFNKTNQKKDSQIWKTHPNLYIRFFFNQDKYLQTQQYQFSTDSNQIKHSDVLQINVNTILKMASSAMKNKIQVNKFLNFFIEQDNRLINIFKLKKLGDNNLTVKLKRESQNFYLNVRIMDIDKLTKQNPLMDFTQQQKKYTKIIQNLSEINKSFSKEVKKLNENQKCSYDIAYMISQPLVQPKNLFSFRDSNLTYGSINFDEYKEATQIEVSFQKEYEKFIKIFQAESYRSNIKIKIFTATEGNLKRVLSEKCNILHFSCHGQVKYLQIQKDRDIGKLDPLTVDRLVKHLQGKSFLKLIIFNACKSDEIAKKVNKQLGITTVGYVKTVPDDCCEVFTEKIYEGIYTEKKNFYQLFEEVEEYIVSNKLDSKQNLRMYPGKEEPKYENLKTQFPTNSKYVNDLERFKTTGKKEPIGIKNRLYEFIKLYLLNKKSQKIFVIGEQGAGKSIFMKKALHYTLNRGVFDSFMEIDCHQKNKKPISSMLQFQLLYRRKLRNFIKKHKEEKIIIIVDHCNDLIGNDPEEFIEFFKKCQNHVKNGKIVLITDSIIFYTEMNIMNETNFFIYKQVPQKEFIPQFIKQYNTFVKRWYPNFPQVYKQSNPDLYNKFLQTRTKFWFQALEKSERKEKFFETLQMLKQEERRIQDKGLTSNLQNDITTFINKIRSANQQLKNFITSGNYSRNQSVFILLNIFPDFSRISRISERNQMLEQQVCQQRSKSFNELKQIYENDIKGLIEFLINAFGKFYSQSYNQDWWQDKIPIILQRLFQIIGMAFLFQDEATAQKQIENQLFNAYTLVVKLMNRQKKVLSKLTRVKETCEAMKLKIIMALYNLYKHQQYSISSQSGIRKRKRSLFQQNNNQNEFYSSDIFQNQDSIRNSIDFTHNFESQIRQSMGRESMFNPDRQMMGGRDTINMGCRSSIKSNRGGSEIKDQIYATNKQPKSEIDEIKNKLKVLQNALKYKDHEMTNQWRLIEKVIYLDNTIRKLQIQDSKATLNDPIVPSPASPMLEFAWSECHRNFESCFLQIEKFYLLHRKIQKQYDHLINYQQQDEGNLSYATQRIFFTQIQLDFSYLQGLKIIRKIIPFIEEEFVFDFQSRYKVKLQFIRKTLQEAENILKNNLSKKCKKGGDLSFKKFYKEFLQIYVEVRFKLQAFCLPYSNNGQKQQVSLFDKLLLLSQDTGSFQLRDSIRKYIEKTFQNKCTILISQPLGYIPKRQSTKNSTPVIKTLRNHFIGLNVYRNSNLIIKLMKDEVQKKVKSQIHIQTQVLNRQKLVIPFSQSQEDQKKRKRLIYLIMCDSKQSDSIFLENSYGESIKKSISDLKINFSFPYAPVVILYGSNPSILKQYYIDFCETQKKSISIISFAKPEDLPKTSEKFIEMIKYVWKDYVQKEIGMNFLAEFWIKFCEVYFNQQHECHRNQIIRSFNIAKQESIISMKKKYIQGTSKSQLEKQIDEISKQVTLDLYMWQEDNFPVILEKNMRNGLENEPHCQNLNIRESQTFANSNFSQNDIVKKENQALEILNHEIGCNFEVYEFLQMFWQNIEKFEIGGKFSKNFIEYSPHLNDTNINTFFNTISHKLLRMSNKFELGVLFFDMKNENVEENYAPEVNNELSQPASNTINLTDLGFKMQILEEVQIPSSEEENEQMSSHHTIYEKRKKVEIYYGVKECDLKILLEGLQSKDRSNKKKIAQQNRENMSKYLDTVFRIIIVETTEGPHLDPQLKKQLEKNNSCKINRYYEKSSYYENLYHVCDMILNHVKKVQNFEFIKTVNQIFNKKALQNQLKECTLMDIKQKVLLHFKRLP